MTQKTSDKKPQYNAAPFEARIFNRALIKERRDRMAENFIKHDFLKCEVSARLIDNLQDIKRDFKTIANLNCDSQILRDAYQEAFIINQDLSYPMLKTNPALNIQADEELIPFQKQSLDLILSCLTLHWVNDLPGTLFQMLGSLKADGLFLGALFGGETLKELRQAMLMADMDHRGGISPHISPFIDVRDAGALMQRAGFALPVVSTERITVTYKDTFSLMKELKAMGENNALIKNHKGFSSKRLMMRTSEHYQALYANHNGRIPATFDIIYLQGWAPHENQQKPLKPGSGKMFLKDALGKAPPKNNSL